MYIPHSLLSSTFPPNSASPLPPSTFFLVPFPPQPFPYPALPLLSYFLPLSLSISPSPLHPLLPFFFSHFDSFLCRSSPSFMPLLLYFPLFLLLTFQSSRFFSFCRLPAQGRIGRKSLNVFVLLIWSGRPAPELISPCVDLVDL